LGEIQRVICGLQPPIFFYDERVCSGAISCFDREGNLIWMADIPSAFVYMGLSDEGIYLIASMWPDLATTIYLVKCKA